MLRVGFRSAGFHKWPIHRALAELGRLGYDGVEMCLEHPDCRPEALTAGRCEQLASYCQEVGLQVASVSYHADNELWNARRENTARAIELVPALGTDTLIINGRRAEPGRQAEALADLESLLEVLLVRAAQPGVRVAIEPEPGLAVGTSYEAQALLDKFGSSHLGVNLDVGHAFLTDEDVRATVSMLGSSIFHTHFEGMSADEHRHLLPGEGDIDLVSICQSLRGVGYEGYYTVDLFSIADDPSGWAGKALPAMRAILKEAETAP